MHLRWHEIKAPLQKKLKARPKCYGLHGWLAKEFLCRLCCRGSSLLVFPDTRCVVLDMPRLALERYSTRPEARGGWQQLGRGAVKASVLLGGLPRLEDHFSENVQGDESVLNRLWLRVEGKWGPGC